ncbi:ras-related protein Rab-22A-like [Halichondria panicea]|uniref:ras-related protein Rab-22A-like n=1 Tax=Halichondria panicea TaxID=6063 RepID=UPI00312B5B36
MSVREVKVCLLGDIGVGKSSLVGRFVHGAFNPNLTTTLGASFMSKSLTVDTNTIKFQIWDTAGQERYRSLLPMYYRNAAAAIIVYDITSEASFEVLQEWITELNRLGPPNIVLAIAGNKCDLEEKREVPYTRGEQYAEQCKALFCETSALNATNVEQLFVKISHTLPTESPVLPGGQSLLTTQVKEEKKSSCCAGNNG